MSTSNGHRQRASAVIAENASDSIESTAIAGQNEPGRLCREQRGCREAGAHPGCVNAECCRPDAGFNGFAECGRDRLGWT